MIADVPARLLVLSGNRAGGCTAFQCPSACAPAGRAFNSRATRRVNRATPLDGKQVTGKAGGLASARSFRIGAECAAAHPALDPQDSTDVLLEPYRRVMPKHEVSATLNVVNYSLFYLHNRHQRKRIAS